MKKISVLISIVTLATGIASAQNLLLNGNFNDPASTAAPTSWTVYGVAPSMWVNHEIVPPGNLPPNTGNYDGTYQMSIGTGNGNMTGEGVYQVVAGTAGLTYSLSVDAGAQAWWWPNGYINLQFLDASSTLLTQSQVITTAGISGYDVGVPYQNFNVSSVAPAGTAWVEVQLEEQGGGNAWFDNALLTVPEPSTLAILAGSLGIFGWRRISRRA